MITLASFLADNMRETYGRIAGYVGQQTGEAAHLLAGVAWEEQQRLLDNGRVHVAFICGLPYTQKFDRPDRPIELLAAPVMRAERYGGRPVYFTDVIVRRDSLYRTFADLRGTTWAYNGGDSNSGYNMPRDHLLGLGETSGYFGRTVASGAHHRSIQMVLEGTVDAAGIDSLVLDMEFRLRPELASQIRIVESIGPCPIPPVVVSTRLPPATKDRLRRVFLTMHDGPGGQAILAEGMIARFKETQDADYDPVREMVRRAEAAGFVELK